MTVLICHQWWPLMITLAQLVQMFIDVDHAGNGKRRRCRRCTPRVKGLDCSWPMGSAPRRGLCPASFTKAVPFQLLPRETAELVSSSPVVASGNTGASSPLKAKNRYVVTWWKRVILAWRGGRNCLVLRWLTWPFVDFKWKSIFCVTALFGYLHSTTIFLYSVICALFSSVTSKMPNKELLLKTKWPQPLWLKLNRKAR